MGIGCTLVVVLGALALCVCLKRFGLRETRQRLFDLGRPMCVGIKTVLTNRAGVYMANRDWSKPETHWSDARLAREICDDLLQGGMYILCQNWVGC